MSTDATSPTAPVNARGGSAPASPSRSGGAAVRLRWLATVALAWLPFAIVTGLACYLLAPLLSGRMPMSADHPVHLARIVLTAEQIEAGQLAGWSDRWGLGFPLGELYPQLGDLGVITLAAITGLSWPSAYAYVFLIIFAAQGWVLLRAGRRLGLGELPGLFAACACLLDVGAYREGGWVYTVGYGVWPQTLSTSLTWLGLSELIAAGSSEDEQARARAALFAGISLGAAVLAHPMALPVTVLGLPLIVTVATVTEREAAAVGWSAATRAWAGTARRWGGATMFAVVVGAATCAWWLVPMWANRGWAADYGWLHADINTLGAMLRRGVWTTAMPPTIGLMAALGMGLAIVRPSTWLRVCALLAGALWLLSSRDTFWFLRLDLLADGFGSIQYQRFLMSAKPGLFLCAGACLGQLARWVRQHALQMQGDAPGSPAMSLDLLVTSPFALRTVILGATIAGALLVSFSAQQVATRWNDGVLGKVSVKRHVSGEKQLDDDLLALFRWLESEWRNRDGFYRVTFQAGRNEHWFMDAPVVTQTPIYKGGFIPGDNFVHKPEGNDTATLDAARVRYVVRRSTSPTPLPREVARFGNLRVTERFAKVRPVAWLESEDTSIQPPKRAGEPPPKAKRTVDVDTLEILDDDAEHGLIRVRVPEGVSGQWLVFGIAGYPRWELRKDGEPIEWVERPILGDAPAVRPAWRRAGAARGGRANGDDGRLPSLLSVDLDAFGPGEYTLTYVPRARTHGWLGGLAIATLLWALALVSARIFTDGSVNAAERGPARRSGEASPRRHVLVETTLLPCLRLHERLAHPWVLLALPCVALAVVAPRRLQRAHAERTHAFRLASTHSDKELVGLRPGPIKVDMRIVPALLVAPAEDAGSRLTLRRIVAPGMVTGFAAYDDDDGKVGVRGRSRVRARVRAAGTQAWHALGEIEVPARPGRVPLAFDLGDYTGDEVDFEIEIDAEASRTIGFDLDFSGSSR